MNTVICEICGKEAPRRGPVQRYCEPCSTEKDLQRKSRWAKDNPQQRTTEQLRAMTQARRASRLEAGIVNTERAEMTWPATTDPDLIWMVRVAAPFDYAFSKNAIWRMGSHGHVHLRREAIAVRDALTLQIRSALSGQKVVTNRVWIDIMVEKPDHRGDAVNVIDTVCDAVKVATGVDDRWYSIRRLDWRVSKDSPRLIVGIGQEDVEESQVCSYCGRILPFADFNKNRNAKSGHSRTCRECNAVAGKIRREKKAA